MCFKTNLALPTSRRKGFVGLLLVTAASLAGACTPGFEGEYSDPGKTEIVDDKWNETDAHKTAQTMIKGMLEKPWLARYRKEHGGQKPIVVVDDIENRTDEHLDVKALTDFIQDELINSGDVRFVNKTQRQKLLDEIKYQQGNVKAEMKKKGGNQVGADYMLAGAISSSVHQMDGLKTVTYQTVLNLSNIESFELEWSTKFEIKKRFKRSGAGW